MGSRLFFLLVFSATAALAYTCQELFTAMYNEKHDVVETLLSDRVNPICANEEGLTPLMLASEDGKAAWVSSILVSGVPLYYINAQTDDGYTALSFAAMGNSGSCIKRLLAAGADPNIGEAQFGTTPLGFAAGKNNVQAVEAILEFRPDLVNQRNRDGITPLIFAATARSLVIVNLLLMNPAVDVRLIDKTGVSALSAAAGKGDMAIVKRLLGFYDRSKVSTEVVTAIASAKHYGFKDVADFLQSWGKTRLTVDVIPRQMASSGERLLSAIRAEKYDLALQLLDEGADPSFVGSHGLTCLMAAVNKGKKRLLKKILNHPKCKDFINKKSDENYSALSYAVIGRYGQQMVQDLLYAGALPTIGNTLEGIDALEIAVVNDDVSAVAVMLVFHPHLLNRVNIFGRTLVMSAARSGSEVVLMFLLNEPGRSCVGLKSKDGYTALSYAALNGHVVCVLSLLEKCYEKGQNHNDFRHALKIAKERQNTDVLTLITSHMKTPNPVDSKDEKLESLLAKMHLKPR